MHASGSHSSKRDAQPRSRLRDPGLLLALAVSLLLHAAVLAWISIGGLSTHRLRDDDSRVVMLAPVKDASGSGTPKKARFVSDRSHTAKKETSVPLDKQNLSRASSSAPADEGRKTEKVPVRVKSRPVRPPRKRRPSKKRRHRMKKTASPYKMAVTTPDSRPRRVLVPEGDEPERPSLSSARTKDAGAMTDVKILTPGFTGEHIPEVGTGTLTSVSTRRGVGADFFLRLKRILARHWHPDVVYRKYDPDGTIYGENTWTTVIEVEIDAQGNLLSAHVHRPCGLDFLDREALRAFRAAAPFPPPPGAMLDPKTGRLRFRFGFILMVHKEQSFFDLFSP